jgi:hypothetical protein
MINREVKFEIDGQEYTGTPGVITRTELGIHDHYGIFTFSITIEGNSSGVSVGHFSLDTPVESGGKFMEREGTAYGATMIMQVLKTMGVSSWEKLKGQEAVALFEGKSVWGASACGIAHTYEDRALVFKKFTEEYKLDHPNELKEK